MLFGAVMVLWGQMEGPETVDLNTTKQHFSLREQANPGAVVVLWVKCRRFQY